MKINYCVVNWAFEDEQLLEPYEWQEDDPIECLLNVELFYVSFELLSDCKEALINFKTLNKGYYLLSDGKNCLAIAINSDSQLWMRSNVTYELNRKIREVVQILPLTQFEYDILDYQQPKEYGVTRLEKEKKQLLLACLDMFDQEELSFLASDNWEYIESGYHLFHEYFYNQLCKNHYKKSDPLG